MRIRFRSEPPPEMYADEPVLFRSGPHWMSQGVLFGLALLLVAYVAATAVWSPTLTRYAIIPAVPLLIRLGSELPRYWRFETVLTSRRLIVNVGTMRDIYHTLLVREMTTVSARISKLGRLMGFGGVDVVVDILGDDGKLHRGAYSLEYVRDASGLALAIREAIGKG